MIHIIGTGVVGLTLADQLLTAGQQIHITTANIGVDDTACSWWAGGMLAPYCEMESAEPLVGELAPMSMAYWRGLCAEQGCDYSENGTLVISPSRDQNMLTHFAQKTEQWQAVNASQITELEPILNQHRQGLFYPSEAHIEPRQVLQALWQKVNNHPHCKIQTQTSLSDADILTLTHQYDWVLDCRGFNARSKLTNLRGVRGEMLHLYNPELTLSRPIRLLHPRIPIYLVPRFDSSSRGQFMLGATMIENEDNKNASVRSVMELLSAVYAVNPAFSQSEIVEIGVDVRPAYPDNLPKIIQQNNLISVNGMYRHGYLLAPAFARIVTNLITQNKPHTLIESLDS